MRNEQLRAAKATLRGFFAVQPAEYLTRVADECRAGVFAFGSTCHCLAGLLDGGYCGVLANTGEAKTAEAALVWLASDGPITEKFPHNQIRERMRRNRTLPIVLAEIRRRNATRVVTVGQKRFTVDSALAVQEVL